MRTPTLLVLFAANVLAYPRYDGAPASNAPVEAQSELVSRQEHSHGHGSMGGMGDAGAKNSTAAPKAASPPWVEALLAAANANPALNSLRSYAAKYGTPLLPSKTPYKIEEATPNFKKENAKRLKIYYGPFELNTATEQQKHPAAARADPQGNLFWNNIRGIPTDITILSTEVTLLNNEGKPSGIADGMYKHHINFADADKFPGNLVACPGLPPNNLFGVSFFAGLSEDKTSYTYSTQELNSGFYFAKDHNVLLTAELVNYTNKTQNGYLMVDMEFIPGKPNLDASFESLSVNQCDGTQPTMLLGEHKKFNMTSKAMTVQTNGYIVSARGHLHDGGVNVLLNVNGKEICDSRAEYDHNGLNGMTVCEKPIEIRKNDVISLTANYDLNVHPARERVGGGMTDEMGMYLFTFVQNSTKI